MRDVQPEASAGFPLLLCFIKIETQNTNVRACRFYERQGCQLRAVHHAVYPELPEEIQLLWYKDLPR